MLFTAQPPELQETLDQIFGCMAILEPDERGCLRLLAANQPFFAMLNQDCVAPGDNASLLDYLPRYAYDSFLGAIRNCLVSMRTEDFRQAFDDMGETRWWRVHVKPFGAASDDMKRVRVMVSAFDITDKIALAEKLRCERERYQALVDTAYDGVLTVDRNMVIKLANQAAASMFAYPVEALRGMSLETLIPDRYRSRHPDYVGQFARSPIVSRHMFERGEVLCLRGDGSEFPAEISISKISIDGELEFTAVIRDISERSRLLDELKLRASTDPLTGLRNRRSAMELGETLYAGHRRRQRPLAVMMLDIDDFKCINDQFGHACGDATLLEVARRLDSECRKGDVLARFGGEEFIFLLPETNLEQAKVLGARVCSALSGAPVMLENGGALNITCSIGLAETVQIESQLDELIARADQQLYEAKRRGKNRVCA